MVYVSATFLINLLGLYEVHFIFNFVKAAAGTNVHYSAHVNFALFVVIAIAAGLINVFSSHLVSMLYNVSVWWNIIGVLAIVVILIAVPSHHASLSYVFGHKANESGFAGGATSGLKFWIYVLPLGFLLTMYTITGYDASAHISEETHGAEHSSAQGIWRSVLYSAIFGWIVLLAITFAIQKSHEAEIYKAGFPALAIFTSALSSSAAKAVDPDLHRRSAVLRRGVRHERLAHDVRVLARRRRPRAQPVASAGLEQDPYLGGVVRGAVRDHRHDPRLLPEPPGHAGGVPRGHLDLGDRAVHRLHDPGVPALARRRQLRHGHMDARAANTNGSIRSRWSGWRSA